jgi:tripartite-type tricarboxylate transporter receptor subunit TctC
MRIARSDNCFRLSLYCVLGLSLLLWLKSARAEDYPSRPIKLIVAFTPGGSTDVTARLIADKTQRILGVPIAVENKPGASGAIAAQYVAQSDADGYTLFFSTVGAIAINPAFRSDLTYDPLKDFAAVGKAAINSPVLVVNAAMKANSAREFVDLARKRPGAITIGITGRGAMSDLGLQLFESDAGIILQSVPYRGAAQAITDIVAGHLDGLVGDVPTVMAQVKAGRLKALGTTSKQRSDIFPDVPTLAEQGFTETVGDNWAGVLAPAATPPDAIKKFNAALVGALNDPELRERLRDIGTTPAPSAPSEFAEYMRAEIAHWAKVIKDRGLKGE